MTSTEAEKIFQSTQPKRAATAVTEIKITAYGISIHAAQEGCDFDRIKRRRNHLCDFNPRSPRGLRPCASSRLFRSLQISIHAAQEGCDVQHQDLFAAKEISIHAAQEGCDKEASCSIRIAHSHFNPRSPRGLRHFPLLVFKPNGQISIHAAQEGCDMTGSYSLSSLIISIHAAQEGCDIKEKRAVLLA